VIGTGTRRRSLLLPRRIARLELSRASLRSHSLVAHFTSAPGAL